MGSSSMSARAPSSGSDVLCSMSSLLSACCCSREASSSRYRILLRTPLMASRVRPGVICTNRWLMFPAPDHQSVISARARLRALHDPSMLSALQQAHSERDTQWGALNAGAGTGPSLARMTKDIRDREKAVPCPSPRLPPVDHLWGQRWPPPAHLVP